MKRSPRIMLCWLACLLIVLALPSKAWAAGEGASDPAIAVSEKVMPAVVAIAAEISFERRLVGYTQSALTGEWVREVGEWQQDVVVVSGSGTVIFSGSAKRGGKEQTMTLILTNHHVISWALPEHQNRIFSEYDESDITVDNYLVRTKDGAKEVAEFRVTGVRLGIQVVPDQNFFIPATVEMHDATMDVALVRVDDVEGVPYVRLGDSDAVRIGQKLYMVGAPLGIPFQITTGSLGQKNLTLHEKWRNLWRYEVPQAPGNSGSGLFNRDGELVAIARGSLAYQIPVAGQLVPVSIPGQHLGVPANQIKFLLRWQGYGFIFHYDSDDILNRWLHNKAG